MKKQLAALGIFIFMITSPTFTAFGQKKDGKHNKKEQVHHEGKNKRKIAKTSGGNHSKHENKGEHIVKIKHKENRAKNYVKFGNSERNNGKGNKGKNSEIKLVDFDNHPVLGPYNWNSETFKNRKRIKDQEKVTLCHKFKGDNEPGIALSVSANALKAHLSHGDVIGNCPEIKSNLYTSTYLQKRTNFYNSIENNKEQVSYSQSIYEYALARLAIARSQLATLQKNITPVGEIERKQTVVVELEQNVSLLQTLIGVATTIVVNKL